MHNNHSDCVLNICQSQATAQNTLLVWPLRQRRSVAYRKHALPANMLAVTGRVCMLRRTIHCGACLSQWTRHDWCAESQHANAPKMAAVLQLLRRRDEPQVLGKPTGHLRGWRRSLPSDRCRPHDHTQDFENREALRERRPRHLSAFEGVGHLAAVLAACSWPCSQHTKCAH